MGSWAAQRFIVLCGFPAGGRLGQHSPKRAGGNAGSSPCHITLPSQNTCLIFPPLSLLSFSPLWFSRLITCWDICHTQISDCAMWTLSLGWVDWNCRFWRPHPSYPELGQRICISRLSPRWHGAHQPGLSPGDMQRTTLAKQKALVVCESIWYLQSLGRQR